MRFMIFGQRPSFTDLIQELHAPEAEINALSRSS